MLLEAVEEDEEGVEGRFGCARRDGVSRSDPRVERGARRARAHGVGTHGTI